ncbi:MAG TPA: hypothetical protein VER33_26715 [Polyangiaceae bacterium]|nr:hypothetical protein [Polyangiaceae bacterium]
MRHSGYPKWPNLGYAIAEYVESGRRHLPSSSTAQIVHVDSFVD